LDLAELYNITDWLRKLALLAVLLSLVGALVADLCISREVSEAALHMAGAYVVVFSVMFIAKIIARKRRTRLSLPEPNVRFGSRAVHLLQAWFFTMSLMAIGQFIMAKGLMRHFNARWVELEGKYGAERFISEINPADELGGMLMPLLFLLFRFCVTDIVCLYPD
jgi:hypothetical protein